MNEDWVERDAAVVWHGFTQMSAFARNAPIVVERAEGHELIDVNGVRYLDAISSLWVNTLGHRVPELDRALVEQSERIAHSTLLGHSSRAVIELAEALAEVVPVEKPHFLFASDGASAVEQALKIAFQYWRNKGVDNKDTYLALGDAYHGDTVGGLSLGGDGFGSEVFDPLRFPVLRVPGYSDRTWASRAVEAVEEHHARLAAVVVEPLVQGAAGIQIARPEDFEQLARVCRDHDVLLVCDEVATGFGRTGTLFASEQCGLRPDIMCLGKSITGGYLPLSATAVNECVYEAFLGDDLGPHTLYHGHSYGGNALAAAVARRHLVLLGTADILTNVKARSEELRALLESRIVPLEQVAEIRLAGLMCAVELHPAELIGRKVCKAVVERGILLRPLGDVVVIMPPLSITSGELERIVTALHDSIVEVSTE